MALNLLRLGTLLGEMAYRQVALEMLARVQDSMERYPGSFTKWAAVACRAVYPSFEVAVTGPEAGVFAARILENYLPNIEIMAAEKPVSGFRLLEGRENREKTLIYICRDFSCRMPQEQVEPALRQLKPAWMAGVDDTSSGQIL